MKTDITDLMFYGEWDEESDEYPEDTTWFEKSSCQYFQTDTLIDEFGYESYEDIKNCGYFISVFRRSEQKIMKDFVDLYGDKSVSDTIQRMIDDEGKEIGVAFRIYAEVHPDFSDSYLKYENEILKTDAKKWADENGVEFFSDYDPDRKVNLDVLCGLFYYEENSVPDYTRWWLSKKDHSTIDQSDINRKLDSDELTKEEFERDYILIPAVTEVQAKEAGKDWNEYVDEVAKKWCEENKIRWYIPTNKPEHIKV